MCLLNLVRGFEGTRTGLFVVRTERVSVREVRRNPTRRITPAALEPAMIGVSLALVLGTSIIYLGSPHPACAQVWAALTMTTKAGPGDGVGVALRVLHEAGSMRTLRPKAVELFSRALTQAQERAVAAAAAAEQQHQKQQQRVVGRGGGAAAVVGPQMLTPEEFAEKAMVFDAALDSLES